MPSEPYHPVSDGIYLFIMRHRTTKWRFLVIISFLNQKGGVGKTTLSINIAYTLAKRGFKVLLADTDPQHSASSWASVREGRGALPFTVVGMANTSLKQQLPKMYANDGYDFIILDGAPRMTELSRAAIIISDLIVMPMHPSGLDIWATEDLNKMVDEARIFKPNVIAAVCLNAVVNGTKIARDVVDDMELNNWSFFTTTIGNRVAFASAMAEGLAVSEYASNSDAAKEINKLTDEILLLGGTIMAIPRPGKNANFDTPTVKTEEAIDKGVKTRDIPGSEVSSKPSRKEEIGYCLNLPKKQHKKIKSICLDREMTIQAFIIAAIEEKIASLEK